MRMGWVVTGVVLATAACGSSSAAPPTSRSSPARTAAGSCGPSSAKTLARDSAARVYQTRSGVYGCAGAGAHRYLLATTGPRPGEAHIVKLSLAGVDVAYGETTSGVDTASATVTVRRLDDGRTLRTLAAMSQPLGPESFQTVESIVVRSDGAVAWIGVARSIIRHTTQVEVDRAGSQGRSRLDTGGGIDPVSLRLSGTTLSWKDAGQTQRATLR